MLPSLIKLNVIHIWPDKIVCYQGSWRKALEIKAEFLLPSNETPLTSLRMLSEYLSQLVPWHPTKIILFGNKLIYRLVSHQAQLSPSEFHALVQHQLQKVLGRKSEDYLSFVQRIHYEQSNFGVGIDAQWLQSIQSTISHSKLYFIDIQPAASWLFNTRRKRFAPNSWNIVSSSTELYFFKLEGRRLNHFKVISIKDNKNPSDIIRKEILMFGDEPEHAEIQHYSLADVTKKRKTIHTLSFVTD